MYPSFIFLISVSLFHAGTSTECWNGCSYQCWNALSYNVSNPSHFLIDIIENRIILTAKNSVCHINFELDDVDNVRDVSPSSTTFGMCTGEPLLESSENCQNFHHILLFPTLNMTIGSSNILLNETILECGSNAFDPQCTYRMRSNLTSVAVVAALDYIPEDAGSITTTSLWLSTGRLVSATPLNSNQAQYGIVMSSTPFSGGSVEVGTVPGWFDKSVQFVSMYEIGDYVYTFFREDPDETTQNVLYSRVSRVCKEDTGSVDTISTDALSHNIFKTFLKARMTCVSGGSNGDIPYHYDDLQDTFLMKADSSDDMSLYAVFTAPENGPTGSAVCVYSFGEGEDTLDTVFDGDYLKETGYNKFETVPNTSPFTCSTDRSLEDANQHHLIKNPVQQHSGNKLHLQLTGYLLKKILVTRVLGVNGSVHEVMFIAGQKGDSNIILKSIYDSVREEHHIISEVELKLSEAAQKTIPRITQMEFLNNGSCSEDALYVGTTDALYKIPVADCGRYTDCCSCLSARDPYCAFDGNLGKCVNVDDDNRDSGQLIQSVADADVGVCMQLPVGTTATPTTTTVVVTETSGVSPTSNVVMETPSPTVYPPVTPSVGAVDERSESTVDYLGTILGGVFGFVGGVVIGIIAMAFCYKYKGGFLLSRYLGNRETDLEQPPAQSDKGASNKETGQSPDANNYSKVEDYERNNNEMNPHSHAVAIVHLNPISNLPNSKHHQHSSVERKDSSPPPYSPIKPSPPVPINGATPSSVMSSDKTSAEDAAPPTQPSQSTPEHKRNKELPKPIPVSLPKPEKPRDLTLTLPAPPQATKPPLLHSTSLTLSTPSQPTPTTTSFVRSPQGQRSSYHHPYSQPYAPPHSGYHSATLPHRKPRPPTSASQTMPPRHPSSVDGATGGSLPRPASAQNMRSIPSTVVGTPTWQRGGVDTPVTPTRRSVPDSPASSAGTPRSSYSGSSYGRPHFQFPPSKTPPGVSPKPLKSAYRTHGGQSLKSPRNPNVKATGMAVEPTTNKERERYGNNVAPHVHTIDRKSKLPNGHTRTRAQLSPVIANQPLTQTTVLELDGGLEGCTDC